MTMRECGAGALGLFCLLAVSGQAAYPTQGEWRQWGGPQRNFHVKAGPLAESWPASGPPLVGTTLYARDREKVVALSLGRA